MRRTQDIRWSEAVGNKERAVGNVEKLADVASSVLFDVICALIFMCSARLMIADVFKWGAYNATDIWHILLIAIFVSVPMELTVFMGRRTALTVRWGVLAAGAIYSVLYIFMDNNGEVISAGLENIKFLYNFDWWKYYDIIIMTSYTGSHQYVAEALSFITNVFTFAGVWCVVWRKWHIELVIAPLCVFIAELLIGYVPEEWALFLIFGGILLANTVRWGHTDFKLSVSMRKHGHSIGRLFAWLKVGCGIAVICLMVRVTATPMANRMIGHAADVRMAISETIENIKNWSLWDILSGNVDSDKDNLTNDAPNYKNIPVLKLTLNVNPYSENIYLKGYYAGTYDEGVWIKDVEGFVKACEAAGYNSERISDEIAMMNMSNAVDMYINMDSLGNEENYIEKRLFVKANISYLQKSNTRAYFPYFVSVDSSKISVEGDSRYIKNKELKEVDFKMWEDGNNYRYYKWEEDYVEPWNDWEKWYKQYVLDTYLDVPDYMTSVSRIADEISHSVVEQGDKSKLSVNEWRMLLADCVKEWLYSNTSYSLELPDLPWGADPIEYFLSDSKKGYCEHYASAATMLLRKLGVPARYASGYIVGAASFLKIEDKYEATVLDNQAHAWVEIFLNGVGWVPVEVTNGYNTWGALPTDPELPPATPEGETTDRPVEEESEQQSEQEEEVTTEKYENEEEETTSVTNREDAENETEEESKIGISESDTAGRTDILKVLLWCLLAMTFVATIVYFIQKDNSHNVLIRDIKNKRTYSAIRRINRAIYKKLRRTGKLLRRNVRDEDYEKILRESFTDIPEEEWSRYMTIVKATAFSKRDFSVDEMKFCYKVYSKVMNV